MKRSIGKILKISVALAVVAGLTVGGLYLYRTYGGASADAASDAYALVTVGTGSLTQEVISTGSLSISETESVIAPYSVKIASVSVRSGQTVSAGDPLATVDASSLDAALAALNTELTTVDSTLVSLAGSYSASKSFTNPIAGRVKILYANVGDSAQDVVAEHGCLYVLSLDGKMRVTVPVDSAMTVNAALSVTNGEKTWTGTVAKIADGTATVTFSDASATPGAAVSVLRGGVMIGSGVCEINMPLNVSSTLDGYISAANARLNSYYEKRAAMYTVTNVALTQEYIDAQTQREELIEEIALVRALKSDPVIYAPFAGIVSEVSISRNMSLVKGDAMFTLYVGEPSQMVISVDELDIINVSPGQSATVQMDAITDQTYPATVEYISEIGTSSSGITSYSVTVKVDGDSRLKLGMNGTVSIGVGQQQNALLVPLTALQSDAKGSYVWLYSMDYQATEEAPGIKTYVKTGLSNENYAAVTAGLNAGDQVLVVRSSASAATTTTTTGAGTGGMMNFGGDSGFTMPSDGNMPSMPSGTGTGGGTRNSTGTGTGTGTGGGTRNGTGTGGSSGLPSN